MCKTVVTILASLVVTISATPQSPPDFSGSWRLDLSRSDATAHTDAPGPVVVDIKQSQSEIQIATTTSRGTSDLTYVFVPPDAPPLGSRPNARWRDDVLVTNSVRDIRGQSVTVQQSRRLSASGNEMIVESIVNVQHGYTVSGAQTYGVSTDIFVRVR